MLDLKKLFDKILTSISSLQTNKVNKTGDTMTSNLSLKASNIDVSKADNNVSSVQYPTTFNILDTSNRIITRQEAVVNQNGNIGGYWYVRNYDTSGTQVAQKGIKMDMNKSGALTYTVSDSDNFRTAINAVNWQTIYPIGCYFETSNSSFNPQTTWGGTWTSETITNDRIIEEGTTGIWNYRKWLSGKAEAYGYWSGSLTHYANPISGAYGYYTGIARPSFFTGTVYKNYTAQVASGFTFTGADFLNADNYYAVSLGVSGTQTVSFSITLQGFWKAYVAPTTVYRWHRTA